MHPRILLLIFLFPFLTDLRVTWEDFVHALRDFTPPSLWGAQLQTPGVAGMESVGGLNEVRQMLMDTILLPAKVGKSLWTFFQNRLHNNLVIFEKQHLVMT